jgi:sphingolipid delta-4 desaturase
MSKPSSTSGIDAEPHVGGEIAAAPARAKRSAQAEVHLRALAVLRKQHPEVRFLAGANPYTSFGIVFVALVHWGAMGLVSRTNVYLVFCAALLFGQVLMHVAGTLVHENGHGLIFRRSALKRLCNVALEAIMGSFGRIVRFQHDHVYGHHPHVGDYDRDWEHPDACLHRAQLRFWVTQPRWARLAKAIRMAIQLLPLGFVVEAVLAPPFYKMVTGLPTVDVSRHLEVKAVDPWEIRMLVAVSIGVLVLSYTLFGPLGPLYQIWSLSLFQSVWAFTLGGQFRSEHEGDNSVEPTRSNRGLWGRFLFNTGFHHEHHTYPAVPWNRLPKLAALAPELFNSHSKELYFRLWWRDLWDERATPRMSPAVAEILTEAALMSAASDELAQRDLGARS